MHMRVASLFHQYSLNNFLSATHIGLFYFFYFASSNSVVMKHLLYFSLILILHLALPTKQATAQEDYKESKAKPRIGIGAGIITYHGDVRDSNYKSFLSSSRAADLTFATSLSRSWEVELKGMYGVIKANPDGIAQSENFSSTIFNGSVNLLYNFNNCYKKPRAAKPYVSIGFGYLGYDSKTDWYDANGKRYYYWEDGSIKDLPENSFFAETAVDLVRDYEYETAFKDLHPSENYAVSTYDIPVSAGFNFRLGSVVSMRLGSTLHYTFTDNIDNNITKKAGASFFDDAINNDFFLYHSFSIHFNLYRDRSFTNVKAEYYKDVNFDDLDNEDSDGDGVQDWDDLCGNTPKGVKVYPNGCPIDTDRDGVPNYLDKDNATPPGSIVDDKGVAISFQQLEAEANDSIVPLDRKLVSGNTIKGNKTSDAKYTVHVGTFSNNTISKDLKQLLRTIKGLEEKKVNDTLTIFTVGSFENYDSAEQTRKDLIKKGIDGAFQVKNDAVYDIALLLHEIERGAIKTDKLYFRVEFEEYRNTVPFDKIKDYVEKYGMETRETTGGLKIHAMGVFRSFSEAILILNKLKESGVADPEVVAYLNGKPLTIEEALELFQKQENE